MNDLFIFYYININNKFLILIDANEIRSYNNCKMEEKDIPIDNKDEAKDTQQEKPIEDIDKDAKQEFLRKELIDKGYNPEDFSNYVSGTKGFSTDEIGLEEYKNFVEQFKTEQLKIASEVVQDEIKDDDIYL